jgi:2-dehydropantoate 2-reductase
VVGSGAVGLYHGAKLARTGSEVHFLLRSDLPVVRARGSIILREPAGTTELSPVFVHAAPKEIGPVDLVIIALKTTANRELPRLIPWLLGQSTALLTLQNGLGADEYLAGDFGSERVLGGLAFFAANRTAPGEVTCYNRPSLALGEFRRPPSERVRALAAQFESAGVPARLAEDLDGARWHKLVWNIPFNGLAIAAGGITTDRICADPALAAEARALMSEVQQAAHRLGHDIPDEFLREQFEVTPPMGPYAPSSLVDFRAAREVEVDAIWGEPLRRAQTAGAATPRLALLYALLRALCGSSGR